MKLIDQLNELKKNQKEMLSKFNEIINETEKSSDLIKNEKLEKEINKLSVELDKIEKSYKTILEENQTIRQSLTEQILDEKLSILKISGKKLEVYFQKQKGSHENVLNELEHNIGEKINSFKKTIDKNLASDKDDILKEINKLELKLSEKIKAHREKIKIEEDGILKNIKNGIADLSDKKLDEETIKKRIKQNKIEMKIGLNWFNKIGMILIIIAVGLAAYYNRENVNNYIKGISFFSLGILLVCIGEYFYRKQKETFSIGLLGGGLAILYSATFFSYFVLKENGMSIIDTKTAIILSIIISLAAIILSLRYDSKIIISIGLIGGYLPLFSYIVSFGFTKQEIYYAMGYLFILNLIVLIISFKKQWRILNYISFILNIPSLIYLIEHSSNQAINLSYASLTFVIYLVIIICYPLINKKNLKIPDLILLAANTFVSSIIIYSIFGKLKLDDLYGALALGFALIYFALGYFTNKIMKNEKGSTIIFYLTALTFAVLMMPFQFDKNWFILGWLVEGTLLTIYGYKKDMKPLEIAGAVIFTLCLFTFYFFDFFSDYFRSINFELKYSSVTFASLLILIVYQTDLVKNKFSEFSERGKLVKGLKYFTVVTFYIFLITMSFNYFNKFFSYWGKTKIILPYEIYAFFKLIIFALLTMGMGLLLSNIKLFYDKAVKTMSTVLYIAGDLLCFYIVLFTPVLNYSLFYFSENTALRYTALFILVVYNIIVIFSIRDLIASFISYLKTSLEFLPLWIGIILFVNITGFLITQLKLNNVSIYIGFSYIILSIASIIYGFRKKFIYIRFFGLALSLLAIIILFLRIFIYADTPGKIISFFGFGILLLLISFIYQMVNRNINKTDKKVETK